VYQEDKTKWSYLAGLIDGEGCISIFHRVKEGEQLTRIHKTRANTHPYKMFAMRISITNTYLPLMKWLIANFGGVYYQKRESVNGHKASYEWRPKGRNNVEKMLLGILPYMVIKKEQTQIALDYIRMTIAGERNPDKREQLYLRAKDLNRKGISVTTNTPDCPENGQMIESDLDGDAESEDQVTDLKARLVDYYNQKALIQNTST
jgi:hypothetical protein